MADISFPRFLHPKYSRASITYWNRLDSYPRTKDIGRGLKAEVRDAMWMLTRQWQFGEFRGEDAGSPVSAKISGLHITPSSVSINNKLEPYDASIPLEAIAEREAVRPTLKLSLQMGRMLFKLMKAKNVHSSYSFFLQKFPLALPTDHEPLTKNLFDAVTGSVANGFDIYSKAKKGIASFFSDDPDIPFAGDVLTTIRDVVLVQFVKWFDLLYFQSPPDQSAWIPDRMEYSFNLHFSSTAPTQTSLSAPEYRGGRLDWTDFDLRHDAAVGSSVTTNTSTLASEEKSNVFLPSMVTFKGMPHPRFWQMEEGSMDFGKIEDSPAGIVGLLLAEYGLAYSNDWFLLPYPAAINTVCAMQGVLVTDVFGQRIFVASRKPDAASASEQFAMFHLSQKQLTTPGMQLFYLPPVTGVIQIGDPLERVYFMRDEMANLVWAIEDIVPSETGGGTKIVSTQPLPIPEDPIPDTWKYTLGTTVPENWIPFIAVHKKDSTTEIQLQRARIPNTRPPRTLLLTENQPVYLIEPQEVPRSGVIIERAAQRIRWMDGRTFLWIGRRKMTGRGEGSSGLEFDKIQ